MHTQAKLALLHHNSMVVAAWLYPAHEVAQTSELYTRESLKMRLHIGHVIEWIFLLDGLPLLLALP